MDTDTSTLPKPIFVGGIREANALVRDTCALEGPTLHLREYHLTLNSDLRREQGASNLLQRLQDYVFSIPYIFCYSFAIDYNKKGFLHAHLWVATSQTVPYNLLRVHWYHNSYVTPVYDRKKIFDYMKLHAFAPSHLQDTIPYEMEPIDFLLEK